MMSLARPALLGLVALAASSAAADRVQVAAPAVGPVARPVATMRAPSRPPARPPAPSSPGGGAAVGGSALGTNYCGPAPINVTGQSGAIAAFGSTTIADGDLTLVASFLPTHTLGWFIASQSQGFTANPGGSVGHLCLSGQVSRFNWFPLDTGPLGEMTLVVDLANIPSPTGGTAITAGTTWNFQALFRDAVAGVGATNLSDAVSIQFQ